MRILPSCNTKVLAVASSSRHEPGRSLRVADSSLTLACGASMIDVASRRPQSHRRCKGVTRSAERCCAFQPKVRNHSATGGEICQKPKE
jgi:hypothetical protein